MKILLTGFEAFGGMPVNPSQIRRLADQYEPPPKKGPLGKPKRTKGRNLLEHLIKYKTEVLRFAMQPHVPFSNNQAE